VNDDRGSWYLLTGLIFGIILGLLYAWVISPLDYVDTSPATLRDDYKDAYRLSISLVYLATGDVERARARLDLLKEDDVAKVLAEQAQRYLAEGKPEEDVKALGLLAAALRASPTPENEVSPTLAPSEEEIFTATVSPTPQQTPTSLQASTAIVITNTREVDLHATQKPQVTFTPTPTITPSPTMGLPFVLKEKKEICNPDLEQPLIQVVVMDAASVEVPNVTLIINWDDSEEKFYTGMKPEMGMGYADYTMAEGEVYIVHVADGGELVKDLAVHECKTDDGKSYLGGWLLIFAQP